MAQELQIILHSSIGILDRHPVSGSVQSRETFLTLNETSKIIADKALRFFLQPIGRPIETELPRSLFRAATVKF
jgi:hypothetical protein